MNARGYRLSIAMAICAGMEASAAEALGAVEYKATKLQSAETYFSNVAVTAGNVSGRWRLAAADTDAAAAAPTALGPGGGEAGRVFQAYLAATRKADIDALLPTVIRMQADAIREKRGTPVVDHLMQLNRQDALQDAVVSGGRSQADKATLEFTAARPDGQAVAGTVDLLLQDGAWRVKQVRERNR
jgi:hypothetical protein